MPNKWHSLSYNLFSVFKSQNKFSNTSDLCHSLFKNPPLASIFLKTIAKLLAMAHSLWLPHPYLCDLIFYYSPPQSLAPAIQASAVSSTQQNSCVIAVSAAVHSTWNFLLQIQPYDPFLTSFRFCSNDKLLVKLCLSTLFTPGHSILSAFFYS